MTGQRTTFASLVAIALAALMGCSSSAKQTTTDSGTGAAPDHPAVTTSDAADAPADTAMTDGPQLPVTLMAPPQPDVTCSGDADAGGCTLPPSACALEAGCDAAAGSCSTGPWVVYYENARCVGGRCVWDESYFQCVSHVCINGGCLPQGTTAAATP